MTDGVKRGPVLITINDDFIVISNELVIRMDTDMLEM